MNPCLPAVSRYTTALLLLLLLTCLYPARADDAVEVGLTDASSSASQEQPVNDDPNSASVSLDEQATLSPTVELLAAVPMTASAALPPAALPAGRQFLELRTALGLALAADEQISALQQEQNAALGREMQAGASPNPEFEAELDEFLGTAEMRLFRSASSSVGLSQLVERNRKRCARMTVAQREGELVQYDIEVRELDLMIEVSRVYAAAQVQQEQLGLALELEQVLQQVHDTVSLRLEGGKAARVELARVEVDLARARLDREKLEAELAASLHELASYWPAGDLQFDSVTPGLSLPAAAPDFAALRNLLEGSPDLARWEAERSVREARREAAWAEGLPDMTLSGGLTRLEETDSFGFRVGISFPLAWSHRNQGAVLEAEHLVQQVDNLAAADRAQRERELLRLYDEMTRAWEQSARLREELLPAASESFELTRLGYSYGKFELLDVLDAQRSLIEGRAAELEARAAYFLAAVEVQRVLGSFDLQTTNNNTLEELK